MPDLSVNRTLVKSPPELWSELSEVESLARHLGEFGEITISRLDPEHTVAWEGEHARGTVELEASGWGTKVTLSAALPEEGSALDADAFSDSTAHAHAEDHEQESWQQDADWWDGEDDAEDHDQVVVTAAPRRSWFERLRFWGRATPEGSRADEDGPTLEFEAYDSEHLAWYEPDPGDGHEAIEEEPAAEVEAEPAPEPEADPEPAHVSPTVEVDPQQALAVLERVLDTLGAAHHRPFSRQG